MPLAIVILCHYDKLRVALQSHELPGPHSPVSETGDSVLSPPLSPEAQALPTLLKYPHGIDLLRKPRPGPENIGMEYENLCFAHQVSQLSGNEYAFGPGIIDAAFGKIGMKMKVPDSLIVKTGPDGLKLVRISEYRIGSRKSNLKLRGFAQFTRRLRGDPEIFTQKVKEITNGEFAFRPLIVPRNRSVKVEFIAPRVAIHDMVKVSGIAFPGRHLTLAPSPAAA